MKNLVLVFVLFVSIVSAQDRSPMVSLDGTSLQYSYSNGSTVDAKFEENKYYFNWVSGPYKGVSGVVSYKVIKLNRKKFIVNFYVEEHRSYVTLYFDFKKDLMVGSAFIDQPNNLIQSLDSAVINKHVLVTN